MVEGSEHLTSDMEITKIGSEFVISFIELESTTNFINNKR